MSAALHLAGPSDIDRLLPLVVRAHEERGIELDEDTRRAALEPLLTGNPLGAVYLIGPARAPVGYVVVTFGWSIELGGMDGFVDELFVRPSVRGRGIGSEVLHALGRALGGAGIRALHIEIDRGKPETERFYTRGGYVMRDRSALMTRKLA